MRTLAVVLLALVAVAAGGLWIFAEFGRPAGPVAEIAAEQPDAGQPLIEDEQPAPAPEPASAPVAAPSEPAPAPKHELTSKDAPPPAPVQAAPAPATAPATAQPAPPSSASSLSADGVAAKAIPEELASAARNLPGLAAAKSAPAPEAAAAPEAAPEPSAVQAAPVQAAPIQAERRVEAARVAEAAPSEPAGSSLASEFRSRQVAYNRPPSKLVLGRPIDVSLVINATADEEAAREALEGFKGEIVERDVELSNIVSAQLTGVGFDIVTQSVERQKLSDRTLNRWQWRITPTEPGTHTLILEIFGYASGALEAEPLDAYRDEIVVEVRELDRLVNLAQRYQPVFAVVAGAAGAISALLAVLRFRADRKKK